MDANIDIPAQTDQPTKIEAISINHANRTATAHITGIGRGQKITISVQPLLDLMTTTQKQTVNTFLKKCALLIWQEYDSTVIENDITGIPDFDV